MPAWERASSFEEYLTHKKINGTAWQAASPAEYAEAQTAFQALGPVSFDQRKKFLINDWRLQYPALPPEQRRSAAPHAGALPGFEKLPD